MKKINSYKDYKIQKRRNKIMILSIQIFILVSFFVLWEVLSSLDIINSFLVSKPSKIIALFKMYVEENIIWNHLKISIIETILGLIIGTFLGLLISTILYIFPIISKILDPFLVVLNALPKTALAPIIIIWIGTNIKGIVGVAISLNIVMTIISSLSYFNSTDKSLIKMMKTMSANKFQILFKIVYPSNFENLISLIKVNIGMSWVGVIVGEFIVSKEGIGYLVVYGGQVFKMDLVMMGVLLLAITALVMYLLVNIIQYLFTLKRKRINKLKK